MDFVEEVGNVDYELFGFSIGRNGENGFLSVTNLQATYDSLKKIYGWGERAPSNALENEFELQCIHNFIKSTFETNDSFLEFRVKTEGGIIKFLKNYEVWKTTGKGKSRMVYCCAEIWKILCFGMFPAYCFLNKEPDWLKKIITPIQLRNRARVNSKENHFIEESIDKMRLFLTEEPTKQYIIGKYRYDLMFRLFDKRIIVEYNEGQHANSTKEDFLKSEMAYKNGFYVVYIPHFKESDFKEYMLDIASNSIDANGLFLLAKARFSVYDKNNQVLKKYTSLINKKILNTESIGVRAMCSLSDLKNLVSLESKLLKIINKNPSMNFKEISAAIKDFKI